MPGPRTPGWIGDDHVADLFAVPEATHSGDRSAIPVSAYAIRNARRLVAQSGVVAKLAEWRTEDGYEPTRGGRPALVSDEQVLALMQLVALESGAMGIHYLRDLVVRRLRSQALPDLPVTLSRQERRSITRAWQRDEETRAEARDALGLPDDGAGLETWYQRLWRAFKRVTSVLDPYPETKYKARYTQEAYKAIKAGRDPELSQRRIERLAEFSNALVWASVNAAPERAWACWDGTFGIDATPILAARIGTTKRSSRASSEPDAAWYNRNHEARGGGYEAADDLMWAWDLHLATMASPNGQGDHPRLFLGMSLDQASFRPAWNTQKALANLLASDAPRGFAVGDMHYLPMRKPEDYQIPVRKAGYKLVGAQAKGESGLQGEFGGVKVIDGGCFCPGIPDPLVTIAADLVDGRIDQKTANDRIERRRRYALKLVERKSNGDEKLGCPARGPGATLKCPLARKVEQAQRSSAVEAELARRRAAGLPDTDPDAGIPKLPPVPAGRTQVLTPPANPGPICQNLKSVTLPVEAVAKYRQQGPLWGTPEWHQVYIHPRETIEGKNRFLKAGDGSLAGDHTRRLMRGRHKQTVLIAFLVVADNIMRIKRWLRGTGDGDKRDRVKPPPPVVTDERESVFDLLEDALAPPPTEDDALLVA